MICVGVYIYKTISELPEDDKSCIFSYVVDIDLVWIILDVSLYKKGYEVLDFGEAIDKPKNMIFYISGDEISAFFCQSIKEVLYEIGLEKGIPESLFNEIFSFMESKSPLNFVIRIPAYIEMIKQYVYKMFEVSKKQIQLDKNIKEIEDRISESENKTAFLDQMYAKIR